MSVTTPETLRICRLAMFQLRQDVGVPDALTWTAASVPSGVTLSGQPSFDSSTNTWSWTDTADNVWTASGTANSVALTFSLASSSASFSASASVASSDSSATWTKCRALFDLAFEEVLKAHNWTWARSAAASSSVRDRPDDWPSDAKNALVYCLARELAVPLAGRVEDMKDCHSLYERKIHDARVHDLDSELAAVSDPDVKEVLAAVCPAIVTGDAALPMDLLSVTRRVDAAKDHARAEVLAAHNWSFCRDEASVESCPCQDSADPNYPFSANLPPKCVRPLECLDPAGRPADWKIVAGRVRSVYPVRFVVFLRAEERLDKWPPLVRRAYVSLLAADVAAQAAGSSAEANRLRSLAERDLSTAVLADSRGTGSRRESKGRNFYAEAMFRPRAAFASPNARMFE